MNRPIIKPCQGLIIKGKEKTRGTKRSQVPPTLTLPSEIAFGGSARNIQNNCMANSQREKQSTKKRLD